VSASLPEWHNPLSKWHSLASLIKDKGRRRHRGVLLNSYQN